MMSESDHYRRREKQRQRERGYAEIVRNLTETLQKRNREIERLPDLLEGTREQLYEERKKYQQLRHRCDRLEYNLFCKTCKSHKDELREPGETFEYLNCPDCKPLLT